MESIRFETYPLLLLKTISAESSVKTQKQIAAYKMKLGTALFSCLTIFGLAFFFEEIFQSTITTENSAQNLLESWLRSFFCFRSLSHSPDDYKLFLKTS